MNLPTFLDFFCFRLVTVENESNIVYSEQDEKDSMMAMAYKSSLTKLSIQIQPTGSCFLYISLQICKGCTDVMQAAR